ncbi:MAG: type II toxin-antitoxin system prevent-host-death family antitoxin [Chromatiaceae bacterium]|nr:type II toxin-antitoxin system prevent-host-death family antitoxin [Chromatiaceae bacterium]MCP5441769.1 type II toxin-antitoxin system prevent-host-death family antitoxin [Chromatiaceae bacterium]
MEKFDVFSARDLRNRSGELLKDAEAGQVSLITKHGKPAILAIPFDNWLLSHGVHRAMALHLFASHQLTLAQSAKVANLSLEEFIELLGEAGVPAVDYSPEELDDELTVAL